MRLHLGTLRCKHRTRIGQVTQGFDEECYSFRRCESRLDSASFKVGAGHNFCIFLLVAQATINRSLLLLALLPHLCCGIRAGFDLLGNCPRVALPCRQESSSDESLHLCVDMCGS